MFYTEYWSKTFLKSVIVCASPFLLLKKEKLSIDSRAGRTVLLGRHTVSVGGGHPAVSLSEGSRPLAPPGPDSVNNSYTNSVSSRGFSFSTPAMNEINVNHWFSLTRGKKSKYLLHMYLKKLIGCYYM